ncbi:unnamed protein product [Staurois parvus]|uniref:Uncharacterized protein n=1 Tax=Staurois parvus TaxID=386267 RepID=A0ABN9F7P7_9NEOB|nr:unnamed protein product [Staurois parvus]
MGPPGNRGSWGPCVLGHTQTTPKKAYERYQGHLMGPPTDPGPSGSARVSKWSVRPCTIYIIFWRQNQKIPAAVICTCLDCLCECNLKA